MATVAQAHQSTRARWDRLLMLVGVLALLGNGVYLVDAKFFKPERVKQLAAMSEVLRSTFTDVQAGHTPEDVIDTIGEPTHRRNMVLRRVRNSHELYKRRIFDGPAKPLFSKLPAGSSFEQWSYTAEDANYYVYIAKADGLEDSVVHTAVIR